MKVAAIIVHYGDPQRTINAVQSHSRLGIFSSVLVVANDLVARPTALEGVKCKWLIPTRNLGFGGACQFGASACEAEICAFFNAHVRIDKASVNLCVTAFRNDSVGIVAPYLYHPGRAENSINWNYTFCRRTYSRVLRLPVQVPLIGGEDAGTAPREELLDNEWLTGGAIFCRRNVIGAIGWDGSYFLSFEDVDISMRAKSAGWRIVVSRSALAFHTGESTRVTTATAYYGTRNALWFTRKYRDRKVQVLLTLYLLMIVSRVAIADIVKGRRPPHARSAAAGIFDGWRLFPQGMDPLPGEPLWPRSR